MSPDSYRFLQDYVYRESGIVLDEGKHYLLDARLTPIVKREHLGSIDDLCVQLRQNAQPALRQMVVDAMTTNETLFFRDPAQYDALRRTLIPAFVTQHQDTRTLAFWSAAAASGQEAYSLAMMLLEMGLATWNLRILGTDISTLILERARTARYLQIEVNRGLPAPYLVKYFRQQGIEWQLKDEVRKLVQFDRCDLRRPPPYGPFDIVFCRNVLIYFDDATRRCILAGIRRTLYTGGYLLLGGAEAMLTPEAGFTRESVGPIVAYRAT
jgi:chemotaxis protein methyltransferase CheR